MRSRPREAGNVNNNTIRRMTEEQHRGKTVEYANLAIVCNHFGLPLPPTPDAFKLWTLIGIGLYASTEQRLVEDVVDYLSALVKSAAFKDLIAVEKTKRSG